MKDVIGYILGGGALLVLYALVKTTVSSYVKKRLSQVENELELAPHELERSRLEELLRQQDEDFNKAKKEYEDSKKPSN